MVLEKMSSPVQVRSWHGLKPVTCCYAASLLVFISGISLGLLLPVQPHGLAPGLEPGGALARMDGTWYVSIAKDGYTYDPQFPSTVAFFPAYPLLGRVVASVLPISSEAALLAISHVSLIAAATLLWSYVAGSGSALERNRASLATACMMLWPTTLFFRVAYAESLLVLCTVVCLHLLRRQCGLFWPALVSGLAAGTRPVGIALAPVVLLALWQRSESARRFVLDAAWLAPLACLGLLAYMAYLQFDFGTAFAFADTQRHWTVVPEVSWSRYLVALVTLEPLWSVYDPNSLANWAVVGKIDEPLLSMQFANPVWFSAAVVLVITGWRKGWLSQADVVLSAGLLLIPYVTHSYQTAFLAEGRYASVVLPQYIVMARLVERWPAALFALAAAVSGATLAVYSALFVAWYRII